MPNKIKKILLLIITILIMKTNINVKAVDVTGGGLSIGLNSACSSSYGYVACYSPKFQFRITLVKPDGTKVEGTNSVDFSYFTDGTKVSGKDGITANGHKVELINKDYYKYAYGENTNSEFKYIETYMVEDPTYYQKKYTGIDDPNEYGNFIEEFSKYIKGNNQVYDIQVYDINEYENNIYSPKNKITIDDETRQTDFLSLFAYYSGFTKDKDLETKINIHSNIEIKKEISQNDYYLLIEPTYTIYYNTPTNLFEFNYAYGTASEIVKWIHDEATNNPYSYSKGYLTGLSLNFISQAGCNLYTPLENASGFTAITKDANCSTNPSSNSLYSVLNRKYNIISRNQRLDYMQQVIDEEIGYGKYILRLKDDYSTTSEDHTVGYKLNLCQDDDGILTSSITGIKKSGIDEEGGTNKYIANDAFHVSGDGITSTYCYDTVSYDFSQTIGSFENVQELTNIEIPDGKIIINRSCYFESSGSLETEAINYTRYKDLNIELNVFGDKYNIKYKKNDNEIVGERKTILGHPMNGWVDYQITLTYGLENNKIMVKSNVDGEQNASIVFNEKIEDLFDNKETGIIYQMINNKNTISKQFDANNTIIYNLGYEDNADKNTNSLKCDFKFDVLDIGDDLGNLGAQFRIISLSNPFPARDGKSRIPGTNWLNEENNVYNYIINNRSIQYIDLPKKDLDGNNITKNETVTDPEMMYLSREPIYTVTLDPQTMLKIRKYNRNKDYTDINLTCDSNNRQCTSSFLRDNDIIPSSNLKGTCADKTEYNKVINEFGKENLLENIRKAVYVEAEDGIITYSKSTYNSIYDLNKNNRMDKEDIEIYENKEKNTIFYTCADKTYKSGG